MIVVLQSKGQALELQQLAPGGPRLPRLMPAEPDHCLAKVVQ
jgi:hypothetical protein